MDTIRASRLRDFIRETLGCECPEQVLRTIHKDPPEDTTIPPATSTRIAVGGRLLIQMVRVGRDAADVWPQLARYVRSGQIERDREGFNRLRVVVIVDDPDDLLPPVAAIASIAYELDDRVHLHVMTEATGPFSGNTRGQ